MPGVTQTIALSVLVVVLAVLATMVWRLLRWLLRTQRVLAFQTAVSNVARRADVTLVTASERIDRVRRGTIGPDEILEDLAGAASAVARQVADARLIHGPAGTEPIVAGIIDQLERAERALEMVDYGCHIVDGHRGRDHDPEAQISIKRGYLNLLHARDSILSQAAAAAAVRVTIPKFLGGRSIE